MIDSKASSQSTFLSSDSPSSQKFIMTAFLFNLGSAASSYTQVHAEPVHCYKAPWLKGFSWFVNWGWKMSFSNSTCTVSWPWAVPLQVRLPRLVCMISHPVSKWLVSKLGKMEGQKNGIKGDRGLFFFFFKGGTSCVVTSTTLCARVARPPAALHRQQVSLPPLKVQPLQRKFQEV